MQSCRNWADTGSCPHGDACHWAEFHVMPREVAAPVEFCRNWADTGSCPHGDACHWAEYHGVPAAYEPPVVEPPVVESPVGVEFSGVHPVLAEAGDDLSKWGVRRAWASE